MGIGKKCPRPLQCHLTQREVAEKEQNGKNVIETHGVGTHGSSPPQEASLTKLH